jgi:uncharacterized membrane protein YeaQ/YmgE (transglycosylase-associated protein family)
LIPPNRCDEIRPRAAGRSLSGGAVRVYLIGDGPSALCKPCAARYDLMDALLDPKVLILWVVVGLVVGMIGKKVFYPKQMGGGGSFGSVVNTTITGMVGSAVGIAIGVFAGIPGADEFGAVMIGLAIGGTLLVMLIASRFGR